jgi:hypothetical protein
MNSEILGLRVASVVFAVMALAQLVRVVIQPEVLVEGALMPLWPSVVAFLLLAAMSIWMWVLSLDAPESRT